MTGSERSFKMVYDFEEDFEIYTIDEYFSEAETHFGVPWRIRLRNDGEHICPLMQCEWPEKDRDWKIEVELEISMNCSSRSIMKRLPVSFSTQPPGEFKCAGDFCFETVDVIPNFIENGKIHVEMHVKILKMIGFGEENLRNFDETMKHFSDVVVAVGDQKFHVSKLYLASQSSYFNALFLGNFAENGKSEIELKDIKPEDFQKFLEVIYGELAIKTLNIEPMLQMADMYDAPTVTKKCEHFLTFEKPDFPLKDKLRLSSKFKMENLKKKCLEEIKTIPDIRAVLPADLSQLDPSVKDALLQKMLDFSNDK